MADEQHSLSNSDAIEILRIERRDDVKTMRDERRKRHVDAVRIGIGETSTGIANLKGYSPSDVSEIAVRIRKQKHADSSELNCLAHAFIQSTENITCFMNTSGALGVLVKEVSGNDADRQMLAMECLCNLSLGIENDCEKLATSAASYLIILSNSQDEGLVLTSLWTLTNLAAAGMKPLHILLRLEFLKTLLALKRKNTSVKVIKDIHIALEVVLSLKNKLLLSSSDYQSVIDWTLDCDDLADVNDVNLAYRTLCLMEFNLENEHNYIKFVELCVKSLRKVADSVPAMNSCENTELTTILKYLTEIAANICSRDHKALEHFLNYGFIGPKQSVVEFFNKLFACTVDVNVQKQLFHFLMYLMKMSTDERTQQFLNTEDLQRLKVPIDSI